MSNSYFNSYFSRNPLSIDASRSSFPRPHKHYTSFNAGVLVPIGMPDEVLPGDTVKRKIKVAMRLTTPRFPTMDHAFLDVFTFFVPGRLTQNNWRKVFGESDSPWESSEETQLPVVSFSIDSTGIFAPHKGSVADHMCIPLPEYIRKLDGYNAENFAANGWDNYYITANQARGYCLIWNEYFRDVNLMDAAYCPLDDLTRVTASGDPITTAHVYGDLLPVSKAHDYFTSTLPYPQRGADVSVPLSGLAPVVTGTTIHGKNNGSLFWGTNTNTNEYSSLKWCTTSGGSATVGAGIGYAVNPDTGLNSKYFGANVEPSSETVSTSGAVQLYPANLYADLSESADATINTLRLAIATQQYLEKLARSGNRYRSFLYSFFGVTSPDASMQIPQYISGKRIPLRISQVVQTSSDNFDYDGGDQPLGATGAYSLTVDVGGDDTTSFTEHGWLYTVACLRTTHTYAQGLHKQWTRTSMLDFYTPIFANVGELPVYKKELVFSGNKDLDDSVFGYQEAFAEYRYTPNTASSDFHPLSENTLLPWTYIDKYTSVPSLSADWVKEDPVNLDRSLIYSSKLYDQVFGEFYFDDVWTRVMPVNSIPGLYKL